MCRCVVSNHQKKVRQRSTSKKKYVVVGGCVQFEHTIQNRENGDEKEEKEERGGGGGGAVSYTHLTLPTNAEV